MVPEYVDLFLRRGFRVPDLYIRLEQDGLLRYGTSREDWRANHREICRTRPPALLCARSRCQMTVEWYSSEEILSWERPEYWRELGLVPFAGNGYGDEWCWYPAEESDQGVPVLFCAHDENVAERFAASFEAFLYRSLLESFTYIPEEDVREDDDTGGHAAYLTANVASVAPYLRSSWADQLRAVVQRPLLFDSTPKLGGYYFLLTEDEATSILRADVLVAPVGSTFEHMELE